MPQEEIVLTTPTNWYQTGATIAVVFVAVFAAIAGPYISNLFNRWRLARDLKLEFEPIRPYCHRTKFGESEFPVFWFMFGIHNKGKYSAKSCQLFIEELYTLDNNGRYHLDSDFWSSACTWQTGKETNDINAGSRSFANFGYIADPRYGNRAAWIRKKDSDGVPFYLTMYGSYWAKRDYVSAGLHRFKATIVGENFNPIARQVNLCWCGGDWAEDEQEMIKKVVITVNDWSPPK